MDAFFLAALNLHGWDWLFAVGLPAFFGLVFWIVARKLPLDTYPARASHPLSDDVVTQAELATLMRKQDEIHRRHEARISGLERTMTNQLQEINRSLGRIEGKIEKL